MKEDGSVCACKSESLFHFLILFYFDFIYLKHQRCYLCDVANHSVNNFQSCRDISIASMELYW